MASNNFFISQTRNIKIIRSGFRRDYTFLNELIKDWYQGLAGEGRLCLAISRKAPRLLEWCKQEFGAEESLHVVSELALPFVDMRNYSVCTVVDEAIYNGTTFSKVLSIANCLSESADYEAQANPLVLTSSALENPDIMTKLVSTQRIEKRDTYFFIDAIISKFLTLGKSYDIEYPIFYIELDREIDENRMNSMLEHFSILERNKRELSQDATYYYGTHTYSREQERSYSSYTYLTDYLYRSLPSGVKPEFAKLRFFKKGSRLSIVSMSPYVVTDAYVDSSVAKFDAHLEKIWRYIKAASKRYNIGVEDEEYNYQKRKSLVVMMNYLLSFTQFLKVKESLEQVLMGEILSDFKVDGTDLVLLMGEMEGKQVAQQLNAVLASYPQEDIAIYPVCNMDGAMIPFNYENDYRFWINVDNLDHRTITLSQMISNQFSAMHWYVELPSRSLEKSFNRLRFGESYASLYQRYQDYFAQGVATKRQVSQAIDARIDRGSIVPNYVRHQSSASDYWTRLFRSGENEDYDKDQLLRTVLHVFQTYCDKRNGNIIPLYDMLLILGMVAIIGKYSKERDNLIFGRKLSVGYADRYQVKASLEDSEVDLIEFAIDNKVLMLEDDSFLRLADTTYAHELTHGVAMSEDDENTLDSYIEYVNQLREGGFERFDMRETLNYLMYEATFWEDRAQTYLSSLVGLLRSGEPFDFSEMESIFMQLYQRMPEPNLSIPHVEPKDISEIINEAFEMLMIPLQDRLQSQRWFDKLMVAYYVLNVWSQVKFKVSSSRFTLADIGDRWPNLADMHICFKDDVSISEWIRDNDSYSKLESISIDSLKERLLELLTFFV